LWKKGCLTAPVIRCLALLLEHVMTEPSPGPSVQLLDLLERWQALEKQGRIVTAAEVCSDCPELADELERVARFTRQVEGLAADTHTDNTVSLTAQTSTMSSGIAEPAVPTSVPSGERYAIEGMLGQGGMGAVYRAQDRLLGRTVR
jgi:hypothetical protein